MFALNRCFRHSSRLAVQRKSKAVEHFRTMQEGILAINKPPNLTSAQVLRNLQNIFDPSEYFSPLLQKQKEQSRINGNRGKRKKRLMEKVKLGHGGTLDPMATGVLIVGIGHGTKSLQRFLHCTKEYEATIVFGLATETYDIQGKVRSFAPYSNVTKPAVESALHKFRGRISQKPPIYSALRIDGKRLYEYARQEVDLPREIEERQVDVHDIEVLEWWGSGDYECHLPDIEAKSDQSTSEAVRNPSLQGAQSYDDSTIEESNATEIKDIPSAKVTHSRQGEPELGIHLVREVNAIGGPVAPSKAASIITPESAWCSDGKQSGEMFRPPAIRLRLTVGSGFYVRSLAHDLGSAVGSVACLGALVRSKQAEFQVGKNAMEYDLLRRGEKVWAPEIEKCLTA